MMLERYFYSNAAESGDCTMLGRWWDRKGENEIDLIQIPILKGCSVKIRGLDMENM